MGDLTYYGANKQIDHVLGEGGQVFTRPTHWYIALCTSAPTKSSTGATLVEPSGACAYARQICDGWSNAAARSTGNTGVISFPEATGSWGTITHYALVDSASGAGNVFAFKAITPKAVGTGDDISVAIGAFTISWDSGKISTYLANKLLDHCLKGTAYTQPATIFSFLAKATVTDTSTGTTITEPTGSNYVRKASDDWTTSSLGVCANGATITFATVTTAWGTVLDGGLTDKATLGNVLFYKTFTTAKVIGVGDVARWKTGFYTVSMS